MSLPNFEGLSGLTHGRQRIPLEAYELVSSGSQRKGGIRENSLTSLLSP